MVRSLIHLPDEILNSILCYSSPQTCVAVEKTNTRFRNVTNEPLLWRHHCQSHYKFWDGRHELPRRLACPVHLTDWKALFVSKYQVGHYVTRLLDNILGSQTGRIEKFRRVINLGYDAKDTLLHHSLVESGDDHLARRWATDSMQVGILHIFLAFFYLELTSALCQSIKGTMPARS
jgi:F-box protein 21